MKTPRPHEDAARTAAARQALLELIEADRAQRCAQTLDDARTRARAVLDQARAAALARVRKTFAEQRRLRSEHLAAAQARLATQRRLHEQQRKAELLQLAHQQLPVELVARWRAPASRATWVEQVLTAALARLPAGAWCVVHAPDWPAAEREPAAARVAAHTGTGPMLQADAGIAAGLKVVVAGHLIDGTVGGLLADRAEFEAALLREMESPS